MKQQEQIDTLSKFAVRLAQERRRVHPHQGDFARAVGVSQGQQSLYERGQRELRASYLEACAAVGIDVGYVLTGVRSLATLDEEASELVTIFLTMPDDMRAGLLTFARSMGGYVAKHGLGMPAESQTLHSRRPDFRGEDE